MPSTSLVVTYAIAATALSYLIYFDYKRRNSPDFRRHLKKSTKKHERAKTVAAEAEQNQLKTKIETSLRESLQNDPLPEGLEEREKFFVAEVARADDMLNSGDGNHFEAALAFYRALRVYPSPVDLLGIYDKSLKAPTLDILRMMIIIEPPQAIASVLNNAAAAGGLSGAGLESLANRDLNVD